MVTIRNIDETFRFYGSFGAKQMNVGNGTCFTFPDNSYIRFWGDLHGFCVAAVDFTPPEDAIFRSQIQQRYLGIGFHEEGHYVSYMRKSDARDSTSGISCFVFPSPAPHFLKLMGGQRLRFHGIYVREAHHFICQKCFQAIFDLQRLPLVERHYNAGYKAHQKARYRHTSS